MPYVPQSKYKAPFYLLGGHVQTIWPNLTRSIKGIHYTRERMWLADGDFMDLDWSFSESENLIILVHGLEGSSDREYIKGMVRHFNANDWNACAVNLRGCSGEPNLVRETYHSGKTEDIEAVIKLAISKNRFKRIALIGFSLGGNMVLKYAGEQGKNLPSEVRNICAFSTPVDLASSGKELEKWQNWIYTKRFLDTLIDKIKFKHEQGFEIDIQKVMQSKTLTDIDNFATAPLNGFQDAADYYAKSSSLPQLGNIIVPTLLVNAINDPFLSPECYPRELSKTLSNFHFEDPAQGGHVGFPSYSKNFYPEKRSFEFISNH